MSAVWQTCSCLLASDWWRHHLVVLRHVVHAWLLLLLHAPSPVIDSRQVIGGIEIRGHMVRGWGHRMGLSSVNRTKFSSLGGGAIPAGICVILSKLVTLRF